MSLTRQNNSQHTLDAMYPLGVPPRLERCQTLCVVDGLQPLRIAPLESFTTPSQMPSPLDAPPQMEQRAGFQSPRPRANGLNEVAKKLF